jgi:ABC-2 type transport system ATP-binding protein
MNALEIRGLTKRRGDFALQGLDLTLPAGCIMGLIGENGAGKSTTIRLILNGLRRDGGTIAVYGKDNRALTALEREDIGVVLDEVGLPEYMNAQQIGRMMAGIFTHWQPEVYRDYLRRLALPEDKPFKDFSRGMRMRLGLAAALSHQPKLLLLDEATSGLDPVVRDDILTILSDFTRDEEHAVLISSHIVSDLEKICDYIAFLHRGRLLLCEEKDRLTEEYGILRGTTEGIEPAAVCGQRATPYGTEYLLRRSAVPAGVPLGQVNIEDLFVFMAKEA